mmetsp:Transcript_21184/g.30719  ORF Transcript_21184/g.30719 Transcript_21184/m.30719 type:complete len:214 (-) Transcript_21184:216-857(-)
MPLAPLATSRHGERRVGWLSSSTIYRSALGCRGGVDRMVGPISKVMDHEHRGLEDLKVILVWYDFSQEVVQMPHSNPQQSHEGTVPQQNLERHVRPRSIDGLYFDTEHERYGEVRKAAAPDIHHKEHQWLGHEGSVHEIPYNIHDHHSKHHHECIVRHAPSTTSIETPARFILFAVGIQHVESYQRPKAQFPHASEVGQQSPKLELFPYQWEI